MWCKAASTGPKMDKVPIQYSKIAVDNPSDDLELLNFLTELEKRVARSNLTPNTPPIAKLKINKIGSLLLGRFCKTACIPKQVAASPIACIRIS